MNTPSPQQELSANKALDEIKAIAAENKVPDKFTYMRLERLIRSSIPIDAAASYSVLGALEAISGNEALMDEYHQNSIKLSKEPLVHRNYAASLCLFSRLKDAAAQSLQEMSLSQGGVEAVRNAISHTAQTGAITAAATLVEQYLKLTPGDKNAFISLTKAAQLQYDLGIADEEIVSLVDLACHLMRNHKVRFKNQTIDADLDDGGFLSISIHLSLPNSEIIKLNRKLFEMMIEKFPNQSSQLSVRFTREH